MSTSEIRSVPTVNGRCWTWTHGVYEYQALHFIGGSRVRLYDRPVGSKEGWLFCRAEPISDTYTALDAVKHMHFAITNNIR